MLYVFNRVFTVLYPIIILLVIYLTFNYGTTRQWRQLVSAKTVASLKFNNNKPSLKKSFSNTFIKFSYVKYCSDTVLFQNNILQPT